MTVTLETHAFQAETQELLNLMVNAIYSNKDIFLRELISNSSDAIDKLRFESLTHDTLRELVEQSPGRIVLHTDADKRILSIEDNGIGMTADEMKTLLGTIAKSGTKSYLEELKQQGKTSSGDKPILPPDLIGQFGVGFYSAFMVAQTVTVYSRKAGTDVVGRWESTGQGEYSLNEITPSEATKALGYDLSHGTVITLTLKPHDQDDGMNDYTQAWELRRIVKTYSDFVAYPIYLASDLEAAENAKHEPPQEVQDDEEQPEASEPREAQPLNSMKAIWLRPASEVSEEEYQEFYRHISHDWNPPLKTINFAMEGSFEAKGLIFIPSQAPMDLFMADGKKGLQLYIKRVFIMSDCEELVPSYLRFLKGVVDSEDLSLNISREILQKDRQVAAIRRRLEKKVLSTLKDMKAQEPKNYADFWNAFGRVLKEGLQSYDTSNQEALLELCLLDSTHSETEKTALSDYVSRMQPDQKEIYYLTGDSLDRLRNAPHLEHFRQKGIEVLLLSDPIDGLWVQFVREFEGKTFRSIGQGEIQLGSEAEQKDQAEALKSKQQEIGALLNKLQDGLGEWVKEVRLSNRLTESPACLVSGEHDLSPHLERLMKAMNQPVPETKRILELNPTHPLVEKLWGVYQQSADNTVIPEYGELLLGQALLSEGGELPNPTRFTQLLSKLMLHRLEQ